MSGNLFEWLQDWDPDEVENAWMAGGCYVCEFCRNGHSCEPCAEQPDPLYKVEVTSNCFVEGRSMALISHLSRDLCGPKTARDARRPGFAVRPADSMLRGFCGPARGDVDDYDSA